MRCITGEVSATTRLRVSSDMDRVFAPAGNCPRIAVRRRP
jgi:hypothetical protein